MLGLNIRENERRLSSTVEVGDGDRGSSITDMETARLLGGRKVADRAKVGVNGWLKVSDPNSFDATQTPDTRMNCRSASSVSMGSFPLTLSRNELKSMFDGVIVGDWQYGGELGVGGEVADGIV
jgi:hypothetical protein